MMTIICDFGICVYGKQLMMQRHILDIHNYGI